MEDYIELAAHVVGVDVDSSYEDTEVIEYRLEDRWDIDMDTFGEIADVLIRYTQPLKAPLSGEWLHVFGVLDNGDRAFVALAKVRAHD